MLAVRKHVQEQVVPLSRDEVWNLLSDTNHMNRVIQTFRLDFEGIVADKSGVYLKAFTKLMGFYRMTWKEYPFEWSKGHYYSVYREFDNGPIKSYHMVVELHDAEEKLPGGGKATRIVLDANVQSANLLWNLIVPRTVNKKLKQIINYTLSYVQQTIQGKSNPIPQSKRDYGVNQAELDRLFADLLKTEAKPAYIPLLRNHLLMCDDDMVINMRVYERAREWSCNRDDLLRFFLYCTQAGILNLSWHLICPNCRVSKESADTLSQVNTSYHCDFCGISYDNNLDKYMELCFSVHPAIRKAYKQFYCSGGPAVSPHIETQVFARSQQPITLQIPEGNTPYRLRVLQTNHTMELKTQLSKELKGESAPFIYTSDGWWLNSRPVDQIAYSEEHRTLSIHNQSDRDVVVVLENIDWEELTVTAAKVCTMHEFRRMFSSEILAPGHEIGIENVTFMFTDLLGSTSFYEHVGDAPAYGQVRQHFDYMAQWIQLNNGTIVKNIGDAVMAVFEKPEDGIKAALEIQQHIDQFNATSVNASQDEPLVLKIGLHHGSAISVNSDNRMDYFGRNVNIAARVQGLSKGNDVMISGDCMARTGVAELIAGMNVSAQPFEASLRGIENKLVVFQLI
ncbi:MAG TPA: adenylate/guanylate cyclase domain-containing protein [Bacilli bacterium]